MERLFVVVRADLSVAQQAVQGCHAALQFAAEHPERCEAWMSRSNTLALLSVANEAELVQLARNADARGLRVSVFREPDIGNAVTALALEPDGRRLCRGLSLALAGDRRPEAEGSGF